MYICPHASKCRKKKTETLIFRLQYCNKKYEECKAYQAKIENKTSK